MKYKDWNGRDIPAIEKFYYQRDKFYPYSSGRVKYECRNEDVDAAETDTDWEVWKYSDADLPTIEGPREGAVNTEAVVNALSWNT